MKSIGAAFFAAALSAALVVPAFANESPAAAISNQQFSAADAGLIFEADAKPMQLAALSSTEMKETQGAWVNFAIGGAFGGAGYIGSWAYGNKPWSNARFIGNIGTGALVGGTFGLAGAAAGGGWTVGANIWRFNNLAVQSGINPIWRR